MALPDGNWSIEADDGAFSGKRLKVCVLNGRKAIRWWGLQHCRKGKGQDECQPSHLGNINHTKNPKLEHFPPNFQLNFKKKKTIPK